MLTRRCRESTFYRDIPPEEALTAFLIAVWWGFSDDFLTAAQQKLLIGFCMKTTFGFASGALS
jgi:hypothetical protein